MVIKYYSHSEVDQAIADFKSVLVGGDAVAYLRKTPKKYSLTYKSENPGDNIAHGQLLSATKVICWQMSLALQDVITSQKGLSLKARSIAMAYARVRLEISFTTIGDFFAGRDHSTVINAVNKTYRDFYDTDKNFRIMADKCFEACDKHFGFIE